MTGNEAVVTTTIDRSAAVVSPRGGTDPQSAPARAGRALRGGAAAVRGRLVRFPADAVNTPAPAADSVVVPGQRYARPPQSAAAARDRVGEVLLRAGVALDGVTASDALLVTSELVTNAIRHGGGVTVFRAEAADGVLRLSVGDGSPLLPVSRTGTAERPGGYGWPLVQRLAERVDCRTGPGGKTVTAVLRLA